MNQNRVIIIQFLVMFVGLVFLIKLFIIQVIDKSYEEEAANNVIQRIIEYPYRGVIKDRNQHLLVANTGVYDLMVIPKKLKIQGDLGRFCTLLGISMEEFETRLKAARKYSSVKPSIFFDQMSELKFARIQDLLSDFPGFYIQARTVRNYPESVAANALGYIGEISKEKIEMVGKDNYRSGDYIGISGIEAYYEKELRGKRGVKYVMVNVRGVEKGKFKNGLYDTASFPGNDIITTLDLNLQKYCERLIKNKIGSIVAIQPSTGEVLAFVSSPYYDPNSLTGENFSQNYNALVRDSLKPLFNRALMAQYPPGSVFKTINGLYALKRKLIDTNTIFPCNRNIIPCHGKHTSANFTTSIQFSCNPYYWQVYRKILSQGLSKNAFVDARLCYDDWRTQAMLFGIGAKTGIDLPNEKKGILPSSNYYNKIYGENRWQFSTIYSLGIGQGEVSTTPIQMANIACIFANRGFYYAPHLVKKIGDNDKVKPEYLVKHETGFDRKYYNAIVNGMGLVVRAGTGFLARSKDYEACGKTGTVENPHGADHSVFIGFAPKENPQIAVAVIIENSGFGAEWAAPMAGLIFAKYMDKQVEKNWIENYILNRDFIRDPAKPKPKDKR
ncbi:MAG: penicillin-binding protein 2 [Bacteroidota bacterium]|nr:penicillin-binding protein 2 [Bacteroidota bacterium]